MKTIEPIVYVAILILSCGSIIAQNPNHSQRDTIRSMANYFDRTKIRIGSDTLVVFKIKNGERLKISENVITITVDETGASYKITTQNIPAASDNVTTVTATIDFNDLHLKKMKLEAKTDSGYAEFRDLRFRGWSQMPNEKMKTIDFEFTDLPFLNDGNTPWIAGLIPMKENKVFVMPVFSLFANVIKYTEYKVHNLETIESGNRRFVCWKVDAGHVGPPGYTSYHWYEKDTGRLIQYELSKPGESLKFLTELKALYTK